MNYRDWGAIGALLDEYEKAITELNMVIAPLSTDQLTKIVDTATEDEDCRSIQTILNHVIASGYNYIVYCRKHLGESLSRFPKENLDSISDYQQSLRMMFAYNERFFNDHPKVELNEKDDHKKIKVPWGESYNIEGIMEHAIVHVLRHRRQINRFLLKMQAD